MRDSPVALHKYSTLCGALKAYLCSIQIQAKNIRKAIHVLKDTQLQKRNNLKADIYMNDN